MRARPIEYSLLMAASRQDGHEKERGNSLQAWCLLTMSTDSAMPAQDMQLQLVRVDRTSLYMPLIGSLLQYKRKLQQF